MKRETTGVAQKAWKFLAYDRSPWSSTELAAEVGVKKEALRLCLIKGVQRGYFTRHEPLNGRGFRYSVELGDKVPMGLTYGEVIGASGGTA